MDNDKTFKQAIRVLVDAKAHEIKDQLEKIRKEYLKELENPDGAPLSSVLDRFDIDESLKDEVWKIFMSAHLHTVIKRAQENGAFNHIQATELTNYLLELESSIEDPPIDA